jgi:hypothetical protein
MRMTDAAQPDADNPRRWRATPWSMVVVQFIMSISFGIVGPIMPLYLPILGVAFVFKSWWNAPP